MNAIEAILFAANGVIAIPVLVVTAEVLAACAYRSPSLPCPLSSCRADATSPRPRVVVSPRPSTARLAVLIPAHNEEAGVAKTIQSVTPQLVDGDRIVVVADNCTDQTAAIARDLGAQVIERTSATERGKGFALAAGVEHLAVNPPGVVIIVDADMNLMLGSVTAMADLACRLGRPAQAVDLLDPPRGASPKVRMSAFAFAFKNLVRANGAQRLGIPCLLRGTGMAFPWEIISTASLATGNIVEDMQLGIDLASAGHSPVFCPDAQVTGEMPSADSAAAAQRKRWEHGHLQIILDNCPRLVWQGIRQRRPSLIALAFDLGVPPLALLACAWAVLMCATITTAVAGLGSWLPAAVAGVAGIVFLGTIWLAWACFARQLLPFSSLAAIPLYVLWKVPLYVGFLFKRQKTWVRTARS